jgi:hypothetical protein
MDKIDHLMAEKNENNKDSQKGQVTPSFIYFVTGCIWGSDFNINKNHKAILSCFFAVGNTFCGFLGQYPNWLESKKTTKPQ